jgi:peptidoglycan/xylan/chitin deacetylase (PgdA/CDA1 family)/spore germination protein YaaH/GT2 family glycosyltransferase
MNLLLRALWVGASPARLHGFLALHKSKAALNGISPNVKLTIARLPRRSSHPAEHPVSHPERPVFFDASGRRGRHVRGWMTLAVLALMLAVAIVTGAVLVDTPGDPLHFPQDAARPTALPPMRSGTRAGPWQTSAQAPAGQGPETIGFYMPWDDNARRSLEAHAGALDWLVPGLATVSGADHRFVYEPDAHLHAVLARTPRAPKLMAMVQNAMENGDWDGKGTAAMLADPAARARFLDQVATMLAAEHAQGVTFDLENLPADIHPAYLRFLREAKARFAPRGWLVTLAVPVADPDWNLRAYAAAADRLFLMAYDEHWPGGEPGPIASQPWFVQAIGKAVAAAGRDKAIVAIGNYAYEWTKGGESRILTVGEAWSAARDAGVTPTFDKASGTATFSYAKDGRRHDVWMLDATSASNQIRAAQALAPAGIALWRLGSEDAGFWPALAMRRGGTPALATLPAAPGVEIRGSGEILRIERPAEAGRRRIAMAGDGMIRDAAYDALPGGHVVARTGNRRKLIALTFDDGPDPRWTPQILDVLKTQGVPATFFVTGTNAVREPALLRRIVAEGSELGNHSSTHPDLAELPDALFAIELNATQRLVEAYTGRSMRLFRAPYAGDAEPTSEAALRVAALAGAHGYVTVGLHVDPLDWMNPDADAIVAKTVAQVEAGTAVESAQVVLLHDSGGDRTQTLIALPRIIRILQARGYRFVGASELAGLHRDEAMPPVDGLAEWLSRADHGLFLALAAVQRSLGWLFLIAIVVGMARSLTLAGLAWRNRDRMRPPEAAPHLLPHLVSVLIPAYNEEAVIAASVRRVLATTGLRVQVIVIDDGSRDATSAIVAAEYGADPRVQLLTLANGGKARALNEGLKIARGEIVVALDADTQFEPDTIAKLARWFADPAIGAVAGNAKVGNAVNLITRWQAIEYVTAQNLERRALAALDAIMVVPGAVGAWRRTALDAVGGYPVDTLAEDQDLTIAIQRAGWRVACDIEAVAWTEAPETARDLFKQRFRWAFGTLQSLWKHRGILTERSPRGLARYGMPQALLFQVGFAMISPIIDLMLIGSLASTAFKLVNHGMADSGDDLALTGAFWLAFTTVDLACGWLAYRLEPQRMRFPALRLLMQRFGYRQLLYAVVLKALFAAAAGPRVGWGKLGRSGNVTTAAPATAVAARPQAVPAVPRLDEAA